MFFYAGVVISIIIFWLHRIYYLDKIQTAVKAHLDLICNLMLFYTVQRALCLTAYPFFFPYEQ